MTAPSVSSVSTRLRVIQGHLQAVDRLVAQGRTLEAVAQLRAVRAALGAVTAQICRHHMLRCLRAGASSPEVDDLLTAFRAAAGRTHRRRGSRCAA
ncbi:MAG: metal-sensing transcriptional repressor [Armatimonadota bacterium]|nr:metal-sensing transcriptional repressor [Armatimonadota bacterium]MDR7451332.1 metal-sensing transcriptional repressor [Armatimonadota bacterium]MDR7466764.1 metal-sensing transcriptional repressor [Armatimonadota bacterium]MDR7492762.1 metal-sensing transcriptional repressor [Armatimonadota bacterium]MDR7498538.1 metal-sensing transcriptional repressor [Armatimonadota bacterium]